VSLQARILQARLELPGAGVPGRLPSPLTSFIGRVSELVTVADLIERSRLVTLVGVGGAGKTRLAIEVSTRWRSERGAPAWFVDLAPVRNPELVPAALLRAIGAAELPGVDPLRVCADRLGTRRTLVVLDNCEHLIDACAEVVVATLESCPRLVLLTTSSSPLGVAGEALYTVPPLATPEAYTSGWRPELATGYDAVQLFLDRAGAARGDSEATERELRLISALCRDLDGLPLAIEFAAARARSMTLTEIASAMRDRFALLGHSRRGGPDRHRTLRGAIDWSHDLLGTGEQRLLRRVSVFDGGFTDEAAAVVCESDVTDGLHQLLDASLITAHPIGEDTRYRLYETVREYAREKLTDEQERDRLRASHADYYLQLAEKAGEDLDGPMERVWLARLDAEQDNLRAALGTLLEWTPSEALRLCVALSPFWLRWIELEEGRRWFADALAAVPERTDLRARALLAVAAICSRAGRSALADEYARKGLAIGREHDDPALQWRALNLLGGHAVHYEAAAGVPWFEQAIEIARREGLAAAEALCICCLGAAHCWGRHSAEDLVRAEELVAESVERLDALAGASERIPSPLNVGEIRAMTVAGLTPRIVFEDTAQHFIEVSVAQAAAHAVINLAAIARMRGELTLAGHLLEEARARFRRLNDERGEADVAVRLAYVRLAEGSSQAARSSLERALELRARRSDRRGVGMALSGLGLVDVMGGEYERAERQLADAREVFRRAGDRWGLAATLWNTADLEIARADLEAAEASLSEAVAVSSKAGSVRWSAQATVRLGECSLLRGNAGRAAELLAEGRDRYASVHDEVGASDVAAWLEELPPGHFKARCSG
jgi:predicted ATPase